MPNKTETERGFGCLLLRFPPLSHGLHNAEFDGSWNATFGRLVRRPPKDLATRAVVEDAHHIGMDVSKFSLDQTAVGEHARNPTASRFGYV